jgi:hypothetical protein
MSDELKPDTGGLGYLKPPTGEPTGLLAREGVRPALTPEEWAEVQPIDPASGYDDTLYALAHSKPLRLHEIAARALHGQPFGFTREDVSRLREAADFIAGADGSGGAQADFQTFARELRETAAKIAALLPPE